MKIANRSQHVTPHSSLYRLLGLLFLSTTLTACGGQSSSTINPEHYQVNDQQTEQRANDLGSELGIDAAKPVSPGPAAELHVQAGAPEYGDAGVIIALQGQIEVAEGSTLEQSLWQQRRGPEATLINPQNLNAGAILPDVDKPSTIEFALIAANNEGFVAESTVSITVLPLDKSFSVNATPNEQNDRVNVSVSLTRPIPEPLTVRFSTHDGTAFAGTDYAAQTGTLELDSNGDATAITIDRLTNLEAEGDRYFTIHLAPVSDILPRQVLTVVLTGVGSSPTIRTVDVLCNHPGEPARYPVDCSSLQTEANPFQNTSLYIDPDYTTQVDQAISAVASGESLDEDLMAAMEVVKQQPTAIWLDSTDMLDQGDETTGRRSLIDHLNLATQQQNSSNVSGIISPMSVQIVLLNYPEPIFESSLSDYQENYIDKLNTIIEDFPNLRIITVVEPSHFPEMLKYCNSTSGCSRPHYPEFTSYALKTVSSARNDNAYPYLGIGHSSWVYVPTHHVGDWLDWIAAHTGIAPNELFRGFATNTGSYSSTYESLLIEREASITQVDFIDELSFIEAIQGMLVQRGYAEDTFGFIVDTSRNGWGGPGRPTLASGGDRSRLDKRLKPDNWCNVAAAGIGAPPQSNPNQSLPFIDAYTWIKQPGLSDGERQPPIIDPITGKEELHPCDPENGDTMVGAPPAGHWFQEHFVALIKNAWPPLIHTATPATGEFIDLRYTIEPEYNFSNENIHIEGTIAAGAQIEELSVYLNGIKVDSDALIATKAETEFTIPVAHLPIPSDIRATNNRKIDHTNVEIRILAKDNMGMTSEGILTYSRATNPSATEASDLIFYEGSPDNLTFGGDSLLLPKTEKNSYSTIRTGAGNDTVLFYSGAVYTHEGNDTLHLIHSDRYISSSEAYGGPGSDTYIYDKRGGYGITFIIYEEVDDPDSIDILEIRTFSSSDLQNLRASGQTLGLTFENNDRIVITNYFDANNEFNGTIEQIKFNDGVTWEFADIMSMLELR